MKSMIINKNSSICKLLFKPIRKINLNKILILKTMKDLERKIRVCNFNILTIIQINFDRRFKNKNG